ncbi:MAG: glycine cleavage T C-terminal barrel domain-containing protein, partial [Pseudomonadales bacterium]|nr:glycine cleavage T C-terminal barrel domain-containing protein [Pseudomonadales bacterium]
ETVTPLESNMGWVLALEPADRAFVGRNVVEARKAEGPRQRLCGVVLEAKGVLRAGQALVADGAEIGTLTSGAFSPTLGKGIGLARVDAAFAPGKAGREGVAVSIRGKVLPVRLVRPPFVRNGSPRV